MSINGVITPKKRLHFWLHFGYTISDCVTFFFLGNKKPFPLVYLSLLGWEARGEGRASQAA